MKLFQSWALLLLLASACGRGEPSAPAPTSAPSIAAPAAVAGAQAPVTQIVTDSATLTVLEDYLSAWNEHDAVKAGSFLAEDTEYFDASFAGLQRGRQAVVDNAINVFLRGMPDLRWEIRSEPIVGVDGIAYEWTLTGTNTGTWGRISATQQKVNLKGQSFVRVKNGKISYQAVVYDSAVLNRQLGL